MTEPTDLSTERLLVRPFKLTDIDDVQSYENDRNGIDSSRYRIHTSGFTLSSTSAFIPY